MKIKLQNVRLSYPSLFQTAMFGGEDTGKFEATFILDKVEHAALIAQIKSESDRIQKEDIKAKVTSDKLALKDGDETDKPELQGKMSIKASTKKRPLVINRDKSPLIESDGVMYSGCYVNGIISLWGQNNQWGKRVNASLEGVQFAKDGEAFGTAGASVDEFDDFDDFM